MILLINVYHTFFQKQITTLFSIHHSLSPTVPAATKMMGAQIFSPCVKTVKQDTLEDVTDDTNDTLAVFTTVKVIMVTVLVTHDLLKQRRYNSMKERK